jgi:hypothetical protein
MKTRVSMLVGVMTFSLVMAQDLTPLRFTPPQDTKLEYQSVNKSQNPLVFSYAKSPDGKPIPNGLKTAFETENEQPLRVDTSHSRLNVLEVRDDETRIVQFETQSDFKPLASLEKFSASYTLEYQPDGRINPTDFNIEIGLPNLDDSRREILQQSYEANIRSALLIAEQCYGNFKPNESKALMIDPNRLIPKPESTDKPVQIGEVRLEQSTDGSSSCKISIDTKRYAEPGVSSQYPLIQRGKLDFMPDGTLKHSEWVSSISLLPDVQDFKFQGKTYRVFYVKKLQSSSSTDRSN